MMLKSSICGLNAQKNILMRATKSSSLMIQSSRILATSQTSSMFFQPIGMYHTIMRRSGGITSNKYGLRSFASKNDDDEGSKSDLELFEQQKNLK
jgi:hypothetical protein